MISLQRLTDFCVILRILNQRSCATKGFPWACALILDCTIGILLLNFVSEINIFKLFWPVVDQKIAELDMLIDWLTQNPGGLKLNEPLNLALASFFKYHIYLWHTFVQILRVELLWEFLPYSLICGISMAAALCADLLSIFSMHVLCFYVYAMRLARLNRACLASLWRAFRGKKYNPLRDRVDSALLDTRQLFLATILFVILVFLAPTVAVYFVVFSVVRWSVRFVQICLEVIANFQDFIQNVIISIISRIGKSEV